MAKITIPNTRPEEPRRQWSRYQEDIFDATTGRTENLLVQAVAGSGKTTTIIECMNRTPNNKRCGFVAFNRAIAEELSTKVPPHVTAKTLHAIGGSALRSMGFKLWKTKTRIILEDLCKDEGISDAVFYDLLGVTRRVIGMLKANVLSEPVTVRDDIIPLAEELGMPVNLEQARIILAVWNRNHKGKYEKVIDFDDMLRTAVLQELPVPQFDILYVDEAQDLNRIQHNLVSMMVAPNGRLIAVGDRHQAIYGFRGASSTSMDDLGLKFSMKEMPLSISYRCSAEVVRAARNFNADIGKRDGAPEGEVCTIYSNMLYKHRFEEDQSHMILGRYNYSLFKTALRMRLYNQPVYLMGKDIVPALIRTAKLIQKHYGVFNTSYVTDYALKHVGIRGGEAVQDHCNILLLCLEEGCTGVSSVERLLLTMFPKDKPNRFHLTLCTIHKSKGLEADKVYLLDTERMPTDMNDEKNVGQEGNLMYVAITRAKEAIYYVI